MHPSIVTLTLTAEDPLLRQAQAGEPRALETLYRTHEAQLYTLALRITGAPCDAEDVLQETFLEVGRSLSRYRGEGPLGAWLKRICATKSLMWLRRHRRSAAPEDAGELPESADSSHRPNDRMDLEAALSTLMPTARVVLWLHDVEGLTHEEIAQAMGKTPSFSKSQLSRAHEKLQALLGKEPVR